LLLSTLLWFTVAFNSACRGGLSGTKEEEPKEVEVVVIGREARGKVCGIIKEEVDIGEGEGEREEEEGEEEAK